LPISYSVAPAIWRIAHSVGLEFGIGRCSAHGREGDGMWSLRVTEVERGLTGLPHAAYPNFVYLYILAVNKSLSNKVPYTGPFWLHNATKNNKRDSSNE